MQWFASLALAGALWSLGTWIPSGGSADRSPLSPELGLAGLGGSRAGFDSEAQDVDIYELTGIDWRPGQPLPEAVRALNGRRVVIRGYMHQSVNTNVRLFPLVSDSCQCVGVLLPHHFIEVDLGPRTTHPIPGSFEVIGTLSVGEVEEDGFVKSVYRLSGKIY